MKKELTHKSVLLSGAILVGGVPHILKQSGLTLGMEELSAPLNWLGEALRGLSLSGRGGNAAAWCVVLVICLLPLLAAFCLEHRGMSRQWEDGLLLVLVPVLFALLYFLVNPTHLGVAGAGEGFARGVFAMAACGTLLSTVLAWLVLRGLRKLEGAGIQTLAEVFHKLLVMCAFFMTAGAIYRCLEEMNLQITRLEAANSGDIGFTVRVLVLLTFLRIFPDVWAADTLMWSSRLARELGRSVFDRQTVGLCEQTAKACKRVVRDTMLVTVAANVVQLLLVGRLQDSHFSVDFPLFTLALSSGLFLLSHCLRYGRTLQEDVESII